MNAIHDKQQKVGFVIFSSVPEWFFQQSLDFQFSLVPINTDVGLVQKDPLHEDYTETIAALTNFYPIHQDRIHALANQCSLFKVNCICCDIAPLGILVARHLDCPSILIENFTWDWIYSHYEQYNLSFSSFSKTLETYFGKATLRIQTEPLCRKVPNSFSVPPISRQVRHSNEVMRRKLAIKLDAKVVTVTMGGIPAEYDFMKFLTEQQSFIFILPGMGSDLKRHDNLLFLPFNSPYYHPDIINMSDIVIGKNGYSTVAEVYHSGVPFGYIERPVFPESPIMSQYIEREMNGCAIRESDFISGDWPGQLEKLLSLPRKNPSASNGSNIATHIILNLLC